ncbi:MAG: alpha-L-arabinofuranosidase [Candidatus Zipacnadales bacterium]
MSSELLGRTDSCLVVDPTPQFELSPYLYMQFMEPLGTTDGSVAAAWDFGQDCWREEVIEATRELAPTMIRWGGCFASYYRWKEGVSPRHRRRPMLNLLWGGVETNQVGTHEFVEFCRLTGAEPLITVNFESDGRKYWARDPKGNVRSGDAKEAAEWVRYCNNPRSAERQAHGVKEPYDVRFWQIGNETSYDRNAFDLDTAARKTIAFAQAMRREDPDIKLIGWGDSGWAQGMIEKAGEHLDYLAFHHMFNPDRCDPEPVLQGIQYRKDAARTWEVLMQARDLHEGRLRSMCEQVAGSQMPLALTECHFSIPGRNRCEVMSTWATGVAYARLLNLHERYGKHLKIATAADFCGTRWQVNALMSPGPRGRPYLMPVALVMRLYRHHSGEQALKTPRVPEGLDVTASRTGDRLFLHVVNTRRSQSIETTVTVEGLKITSGRVFEMAGDPEYEVIEIDAEGVPVTEKLWPSTNRWRFPAASVSAVELDVQQA